MVASCSRKAIGGLKMEGLFLLEFKRRLRNHEGRTRGGSIEVSNVVNGTSECSRRGT